METQNNPIFYTHHPQPPSSTFGLNLHPHNDSHELEQAFIYTDIITTGVFAKEPMFQKVLTPSDAGKLNRLLIPKQHAKKYFPLRGGGGGDATQTHQQKGLLLSFEDESGKLWRFRYSYWNSSQSYVLTKGWTRYVKEKRLDAGDLVLFERHRLDYERMFIGWRRRSVSAVPFDDRNRVAAEAQPVYGGAQINHWNNVVIDAGQYSHYPSHHLPLSIRPAYQPDYLHAGDMCENVVSYQSGVVATRRLRLFGVNLDCPVNSKPQNPDGSLCGQSDHQYRFSSNNLYQDTMR